MREASRFFDQPSSHFFLFGPRGTGKSTWLRRRFKDALWIDLLSPDELRLFSARPELLREAVRGARERPAVVIDEVQKVPDLLSVVHQLIEERVGPRFVLTGSSARKLRRGGVDLLAGRAIQRFLHPFMAAELGEGFELTRALRQGLVPLVWAASSPEEALSSYVGLYLKEEVQTEGLVRRIGDFSRFLQAISFSHGAVLNLAEVARECQVPRDTAVGYLSVLEDLLLGLRLPVFARRAKRELVTHKKFYWFDAGVFVSTRLRGPLDRAEEIEGAALEGLVLQHLRAWIDYGRADLEVSYWRTRAGNEVDFVLYGGAGFWAIEVKNTAVLRTKDLNGLRAFREDYPEATLRMLYRGERPLEIDGIPCLPCDDFLRRLVPGQALP